MKRLIVLFMTTLSACSQHHLEVYLHVIEWVDLSHSFDRNTLYWPNNVSGFIHTTDAEGITEKGYYYSSYSICAPEHGGTHLDAPIHFAERALTVDQIPLTSLTGEAVVIDVSTNTLVNQDYQITITDIENWELTNGRIADHSIVLFRTGYEQFYPERKRYFGTEEIGPEAIPDLHFPGILPETAQWLVDNRKVKAVGLDTASLDYGQSKDFKTHRILMGHNIPGFENLTQLKQLPTKGAYVVALPMKIANGSGGPLRIIAGINPTLTSQPE